MERRRPRLDDPVFAGNLRYTRRAPIYARRSTAAQPISDFVRPTRPISNRVTLKPATSNTQTSLKTPAARRSTPNPARNYTHRVNKSTVLVRPVREDETLNTKVATKPYKKIIAGKRSLALYGMALLVFIAGIAVSLNGLRANHQVAAQIRQVQTKVAATATSSPAAATVPSSTKPTSQQVATYVVSPDNPRYIDIPKLAVYARVMSEGVDEKNQLQVPWNIYDTGWYNGSNKPGQDGAMLIDGHSGIGSLHGIFYKLASLHSGDTITVTRGDGTPYTFTVAKVQTVAVSATDMKSMMVSVDPSKPGLNLITCAGDQIPGTLELSQRVQVYAVQR